MGYLIGHATFVDHARVKSFLGLSADLPDELVYVNGYQRFLEVVDNDNGNTTRLQVEKSANHRFNATIYQVSHPILADLDEKERVLSYFRATVDWACIEPFDATSPWSVHNGQVYIYIAQTDSLTIANDINPDVDYIKACREAASTRGKAFRDAYDETTFMMDKVTPLSRSEYRLI